MRIVCVCGWSAQYGFLHLGPACPKCGRTDNEPALSTQPSAARMDTGAPRVMSAAERDVMMHLSRAWNVYCSLKDIDSDDTEEFRRTIDRAHSVLAVRMARRTEPGLWRAAVRRTPKGERS